MIETLTEFFGTYGVLILAVLFSLQKTAEIIVNFTNTPTDDKYVGKFYSILEKLAGIWGYKAKQLPGENLEA
tara:strand:+ start:451 stop:666 length:216 start_codon:yes stop_codon:yes gene_type:complete